ncbi:MAG: carbohydrate kinase family protein [Candidatus Paceibacterota bacterium]|jgi:sugar/nucleoside kinase (ribokinase family)
MYDIITIGTVTVDTFIKADFLKTVKDRKHLEKIGFKTGVAQCFSFGSKIEIKEPLVSIGGGAHNTAVTFSKNGLKTASLFNIGDDYFGKIILKEMERKNITPLAIIDKGKPTGNSFILLDKSGERTILVSRGCSGEIEGKEIPFKKLLAKWSYVVPGSIPLDVINKIFLHLAKQGTKIALNPSKDLIELGVEKIKHLLNKCDVIFVNKEEASCLTGISYNKTKEIFKKLDKHVKGIVVMTDGKNGSWVSDGKNVYKSGIFKEKKVVDRTGAGDAFGSGFVLAIIRATDNQRLTIYNKNQIREALRMANANATSVIERIGATEGILSKDEFERDKRWKNLN